MNASPGGVISPFWQPATMTSTPHASISNGSQPNEQIASTISSAGWPAASIAARIAAMSLRTEVEVSLSTVVIALIRCPVSAASAASSRAGSTGEVAPKSSSSTSAPSASAMRAQPRPKRPVTRPSSRSPGASTLTRLASQAAWPLPM